MPAKSEIKKKQKPAAMCALMIGRSTRLTAERLFTSRSPFRAIGKRIGSGLLQTTPKLDRFGCSPHERQRLDVVGKAPNLSVGKDASPSGHRRAAHSRADDGRQSFDGKTGLDSIGQKIGRKDRRTPLAVLHVRFVQIGRWLGGR